VREGQNHYCCVNYFFRSVNHYWRTFSRKRRW